MNIDLNALSTEILISLKERLSTELRAFETDMIRLQDRLDARNERREVNSESLISLKDQLDKAIASLEAHQAASADAAVIAGQQEIVDQFQKNYDSESRGNGILTKEEAVYQQLEINRLNGTKSTSETVISDIETILSSR